MTWREGTLHYRLCLLAVVTGIPVSVLAEEDMATVETMLDIVRQQNSDGKKATRQKDPGAGGGPQYSG